MTSDSLVHRVDWAKLPDQLVPAIVQDASDGRVLMLGYMNRESLDATERERQVIFFSRSRQQLWRKGETSGNALDLVSLSLDCDADTILARVRPRGPVCHTGDATCFGPDAATAGFLGELDALIASRIASPPPGSYVAKLLADGLDRVAQKVGEEAVETVIAAKNSDQSEFVGEAADLVFHLMVLVRAKGLGLADVVARLQERHR